jgi:phospholipase/carboxylesterase
MPASWPHLFRPATDPARPPLLLLHGTGGTENDLVGLADRISPGSALLAPRGQVSEHGAARFFPRLAEGVFDPAQIMPRIEELADFVAAALLRYRLDASPHGLVALGFSNGANAAAALQQVRPDIPLVGAILLRAMVVLEQPASPGSLVGRRMLLLNGAQDPIVPNDHPPRLAHLLRSGGADVETCLHPETGHGLAPEDLVRARDFLAQI